MYLIYMIVAALFMVGAFICMPKKGAADAEFGTIAAHIVFKRCLKSYALIGAAMICMYLFMRFLPSDTIGSGFRTFSEILFEIFFALAAVGAIASFAFLRVNRKKMQDWQ